MHEPGSASLLQTFQVHAAKTTWSDWELNLEGSSALPAETSATAGRKNIKAHLPTNRP